jgi:uncharacterized protein YciI
MLVILAAAMATTADQPLPDGHPVDLPAEIASQVPENLRSYYLAFLTAPAEPKPMSNELFARHQAYIRQQVEAGHVRLVGPISGSNHLRGLKIISAASAEEARRIAEGDPAVREKVLEVEVYAITLPSLSGVRITYPPNR